MTGRVARPAVRRGRPGGPGPRERVGIEARWATSAPGKWLPSRKHRFESGPRRTIGRMGALKAATVTRRVIAAARAAEGARWTPSHELTAVLAVRMAGKLDDATTTSDVVRLTRELRSLLAELAPVATRIPPDEGGGDDEPDDIDRELAAIVGSGPEMGDPQDA